MSTREGPREIPSSLLGRFFRGIGYPLEALGFIRRHNLWGMAVVPTIVNIVLFSIVVVVVFWLAIPWIQGLEQALQPADPEASWWTGLLSGLGKAAYVAIFVLVVVAIPVLSAIFIVVIGQAVASPFLDLLSEKVETIVLGTEPAPITWARTVRSIVVALADIVWTIIYWLALNIPLLFINIIPFIGTAANAVLSFCVTALLLSQEFVGLSMARQLV
ncbi:EI24 domain-containing protein, partial [Myxococcota bacterium]